MNINKELTKGSMALLVLSVLAEEEMYGYQMIGEINRRSDNVFRMKEGTLYPILHAMVNDGLLESYDAKSETGRDRKYYRITAAGSLQLKARREEWQVFTGAVNSVIGEGM